MKQILYEDLSKHILSNQAEEEMWDEILQAYEEEHND